MRVSVFRGSLILVLTFACSGRVFAQASHSPEYREWESTLFAGGSLLPSFQFPTPVSGSDQESSRTVGMQYESGYQLGVRVDQYFGEAMAAELEYSIANPRLRLTNLTPTIQTLSLNQYLNDLTYSMSYVALPPTKRFRPYGGLGIGFALFHITGYSKKQALAQGVSLRDSWELAFNWGGGVKYLVMDKFALTFDAKDRLSRIPSYGLPVSTQVVNGQYRPGVSLHGLMQNWQINLGASFQWDEF